MAKKKIEFVSTDEELTAVENDISQAQQVAVQSSIADTALMASYEILKRVGRIEALQFTATVTDLAIAKTFEEIKNSKQYKGLAYNDVKGNRQHVTDLEEFCHVFLGKSYSRCKQLSQNLTLLGEELYEQAEQIGFTARDYQALKALPADDQAIVKQAIETEDKEQVIDLMQEMAAKYQKDKEKLKKELESKEADYLAQVERTTSKSEALEKAETALAKLKTRIKTLPPVKVGEEIRKEATGFASEVEELIRSQFYQALVALDEHQKESGIDHSLVMAGMVSQVKRALNEVVIKLDIKEQFDDNPIPAWQREGADAEALAAIEELQGANED